MRYLLAGAAIIIGTGFFGSPYLTQARQRLDTTVKKMSKHELNMDLAEQRLKQKFAGAGLAFPPKVTVLVFFKDTKELLLYAGANASSLQLVHRYPVLAASGQPGPKLRQGDNQVPEGLYRIIGLNPQSQFHLSLRVNYPNDQDQRRAVQEKRSNLGGDIMIHGEAVSIGCIAIGNIGIEEVYRLAEITRFRQWEVILSPLDFRQHPSAKANLKVPAWMNEVYQAIEDRLKMLPEV